MATLPPPIYGILKVDCPDPPVGNKNLIAYMARLRDIMTQLAVDRDKKVALTRMEVLSAEIETTNHKSCGCGGPCKK